MLGKKLLNSDQLDLNQSVLGQVADLESGTCGILALAEELAVNSVHSSEISDISQQNSGLNHIGQRITGSFQALPLFRD